MHEIFWHDGVCFFYEPSFWLTADKKMDCFRTIRCFICRYPSLSASLDSLCDTDGRIRKFGPRADTGLLFQLGRRREGGGMDSDKNDKQANKQLLYFYSA